MITRTSLRIALFSALVAALVLVPTALAGGVADTPGVAVSATGGSGTIALTLLSRPTARRTSART